MIGLQRVTVSPSSSSSSRSTPWVEGCWGPMLMIMRSGAEGGAVAASDSLRRSTGPPARA